MKALLTAVLFTLSFSSFAEVIELTGKAQTLETRYHTVTTCWYNDAHFDVTQEELKTVRVFAKKETSEVWKAVPFGFKVVDGNYVLVVKNESFTQTNNRRCPNLQVQVIR